MKKLIVAIVLRRSILENITPDDSFIAVDDFDSISDLTQYLTYLTQNHTAYAKYFSWTKTYQATEYSWQKPFCEFCDLLHETKGKKPRKSYESIAKWYASEDVCEIKVFNRIREMFFMWRKVFIGMLVFGLTCILLMSFLIWVYMKKLHEHKKF